MGRVRAADSCAAQMLLEKRNISVVSPRELGEMMNIHHTKAAWILKDLGWRRVQLHVPVRIEYHCEGVHKTFYASAQKHARLRIARMVEVLA